jgi:hypothetical protein
MARPNLRSRERPWSLMHDAGKYEKRSKYEYWILKKESDP